MKAPLLSAHMQTFIGWVSVDGTIHSSITKIFLTHPMRARVTSSVNFKIHIGNYVKLFSPIVSQILAVLLPVLGHHHTKLYHINTLPFP